MIKLNDYLYSGDTVIKILYRYYAELNYECMKTNNEIDESHCVFLHQLIDILEHNDFLTSQSQRIRELYKYMAQEYPYLAFTFKGRIKSLIRAEEKFNGYIIESIYNEYKNGNKNIDIAKLKTKLESFRDLIAYRIVISMPKCHIKDNEDKNELELDYLYKIANMLPEFLSKHGFRIVESETENANHSKRLNKNLHSYFRDYIENPSEFGYKSLHITLYDNLANCYIELQLRTKEMDDYAEIGPANHLGYEKKQALERTRRELIPEGENKYFDEALIREELLQKLDLSKIDVNMFGAINNSLINDGCGLYRGRSILPFEHLSRFQNDIVD